MENENIELTAEMIQAVMDDYFDYLEQIKSIGKQVDDVNDEGLSNTLKFLDDTKAFAEQYIQFRITDEEENA